MAEDRSVEFLDLVVIFVKRKKLFTTLILSVAVLTYLFIFFFIRSQYDSSALIIPSEQNEASIFGSLLKTFSNLPIGLTGANQSSSTDMYKTIVYSRTNLEKVVSKFNLMREYGLESMEKTLKELTSNISVEETKQGAFEITARATSPEKAADMTNYIISLLNETIVDLNVKKAKDNKEFLENQYETIKINLKNSEDSLNAFQKVSGIYDAEEQIKATIEAYADMDAQLAQREIEKRIIEKTVGFGTPQTKNAEISYDQFKEKVAELKKGIDKDSPILALNTLPNKALKYLRYYRNVKINEKLLEFIIPLYEQSKIEVQKNIPVLQVVDYGVPPEKRSFPKRTLITLIITFIITLLVYLVILLKELISNSSNPKVIFIREELFRFRK
ncbi:MAG TPA: Wzz/FepE/Etk N-terminal domain-containing protein [Ignavibacteriaceae bacterium]|nr:Wzz/FepE/Etk N-terminal domain-containing protein [Ignavibacteriaceae bacterium]